MNRANTKQICLVASDYLGLPEKECLFPFDGRGCEYFQSVEDDEAHPHHRDKVCGNCVHHEILIIEGV